jgi:hypothetical protein
VVTAPLAVPEPTYVEKYYRLNPQLRLATQDSNWLDRTQSMMRPRERQALKMTIVLDTTVLRW